MSMFSSYILKIIFEHMFERKKDMNMRRGSKISFVLGVLVTVGTVVLVYNRVQDSDKSPKELLKDSKKFVKRAVKKSNKLVDETIESMDETARSIIKDSSLVI